MRKGQVGPHHFVVLFLLQRGHHQGRDDTPLDVQDVGGLIFLREQLHFTLALNGHLQRVPDQEHSGKQEC